MDALPRSPAAQPANQDDLVPCDSDQSDDEDFSDRNFDVVGENLTKEEALILMIHAAGGRYRFLYNDGHNKSLYRCIAHVDCLKLMRIVFNRDDEQCTLEESGVHVIDESDEVVAGISILIKPAVDARLSSNGPMKTIRLLRKEFCNRPHLLKLIPTVQQLKNRKAYLRRTMAGGWEIKNPAIIFEWSGGRMCTTKKKFFGTSAPGATEFSEAVSAAMDDMIILHVFSHEVEVDGVMVMSFGIIFTSRRVFDNVRRTVAGQGSSGILAVTDGTYKLHFGGWTVVNLGTYSTRYVKEHTRAYQELFSTTREYAAEFFGLDLQVAMGSLDHAACIANAFQTEWPDITLMTCWPHLVRKCREKLVGGVEYYENVVYPHLVTLHEARSKGQFDALVALCLQHWRADKKDAYADWFESVYLTAPWDSWHMAASGAVPVAGVLPSQNALESFHRVIKAVCVSELRANTATVLNDSLPGILSASADAAPDGIIAHYCEGPIPADVVVEAQGLLSDRKNYMRMRRAKGQDTASIVFNAAGFVNSAANPHKGIEVSFSRAKRYRESLSGKLVDGEPMTEANLLYQSLHQVLILSSDIPTFVPTPIWTVSEIESVRRCFVCDCGYFRQSGWICAHILATMSILKKIDIDGQLAALPIKRKPGGQFKARGALQRTHLSTSDARFFAIDHLRRLFLEFPARPIHWRLVTEKEIDGALQHVQGSVLRWLENGGRYQWRIEYDNGVFELVGADDLAHAISYSYSVGCVIMP